MRRARPPTTIRVMFAPVKAMPPAALVGGAVVVAPEAEVGGAVLVVVPPPGLTGGAVVVVVGTPGVPVAKTVPTRLARFGVEAADRTAVMLGGGPAVNV